MLRRIKCRLTGGRLLVWNDSNAIRMMATIFRPACRYKKHRTIRKALPDIGGHVARRWLSEHTRMRTTLQSNRCEFPCASCMPVYQDCDRRNLLGSG